MLKRLLILLALLLSAPALHAQSTSLTLNVTDSGSVAWGNGTYNLAFVGAPNAKWPGGNITSFSGSLSSAGSVTVSGVPDVNTITPSPSFWKVTVCPNPAISTTQCWISQYTVTGASLTLNITPPAISIPVPTTSTVIPPVTAYADAEISGGWVGFQYFQYNAATPSSSTSRVCQAVSNGTCSTWAAAGGGGITSVSSLPVLPCTNNATVNLTANVSFGQGIYTCINGIWAGPAETNAPNGVSPIAFGAHVDVQQVSDATLTNGSANVTTGAGDVAFNSATDNNKVCFGTSGGGPGPNHPNGKLSMPQGTLTVVTAHTATCATANANATGTNNNYFFWGTDDTTAWTNAVAAVTPSGGTCGEIIVPMGLSFISSGIGNSFSCSIQITSSASNHEGLEVFGSGQLSSLIVPLPNFNFTTCTGGQGSNACIFGQPGTTLKHFGIWGAEYANLPAAANGKTALSLGADNRMLDIGAYGWGSAQVNNSFTCITTNGPSAPGMAFLTLDGCGVTGISVTASFTPLSYSFVGDNGLSANVAIAGASFVSTSNVYGQLSSNGSQISCAGGCVLYSFGDQIDMASAVTNIVAIKVQGTAYVFGGSMITGSSTGGKGAWVNGGKLYAWGTNFGGLGNDVLVDSAGIFYDMGGNSFVNANSSFTGGSLVAEGHSLTGACTGVGTASSTLGLYPMSGASAATTCTITTPNVSPAVMSGPRTLRFLVVSASAAGVNASSGVVTVLKNGAATTITCTIGTGTSCGDSAHSVAVVWGDLISIQFTTQSADTLAGVKATVDWN